MSYTKALSSSLQELGRSVAEARSNGGLTATAVARKSGRSRDILHRLERGEDVALSSLLDILQAIGCRIELVPARAPTLAEVRARFAEDASESDSTDPEDAPDAQGRVER